jgi:hypothetical protein
MVRAVRRTCEPTPPTLLDHGVYQEVINLEISKGPKLNPAMQLMWKMFKKTNRELNESSIEN